MVKYPAGQGPQNHRIKKNKFKLKKKKANYGSRGMSFEERINQSNLYYMERQLAVIHKKPTPIQVVKVDYPKRSAARITEAYYRQASTTDYNGVYQGRYIDFETKETTNKTSFPLANLHSHQLKHMELCHQQGGIVFMLFSFREHQKIFLLAYPELEAFLKSTDKASIPYDYIEEKGVECPQGILPMIDYLQALDSYLESIN